MRRRTGRRLALFAGLAGLAVAAVAVYAYGDALRESWHIYRLRYGEEDAKVEAAAALGDLRSRRAVPFLAEIVEEDDALGRAGLDALAEIRGEEVLAALIAILKRSPEDLQKRASQTLIDLGPPVEPAVKRLLEELEGPQAVVVNWALAGILSASGDEGIAALRQALVTGDLEIRRRVVLALWSLGLDEETISALLLRALDDRDAEVRAQAVMRITALETLHGAAREEVIARALRDPSPRVRLEATRGVRDLLSSGEGGDRLLVALVRRLEDDDAWTAEEAASVLIELEPEALLGIARDGSLAARRVAIDAIGRRGIAESVPLLAEIVRSSDESIELRRLAVETLGVMGYLEGLDAVVAVVKDASAPLRLRYEAATALSVICERQGRHAATVVDDLVEVLRSGETGLRQRTAIALRHVGPEASAAVPALLQALRDDEVAGFAVDALGAIGGPAVPEIVKFLESEDEELRIVVVETLARLELHDDRTAAALVRALGDDSAPVRARALEGLRACGEELSAEGLESVAALLSDEDLSLRFLAARLLVEQGRESAVKAVPALAEVARDRGLVLPDRAAAMNSLAKVGPDGVPVLVELLEAEDDDTAVRIHAAQLLGSMGRAARPALGALARRARGEDGELTSAATAAAEAIRESLAEDPEGG